MPVTARPWYRRPNAIVLCGCLISLVTLGVRASFGLFTDPLTEMRGWDREVFALAMAIQDLLWGLGQPVAGAVADRFGPGRVLTAGAVLYAAGTALMALSTSPIALYVTGGLLIGLGLSGASFTIVIAAFARLVGADRRSSAIGLATAMGSLGQFLFAPIGQGCVAAYGWQVALVLLGAFVVWARPRRRARRHAGRSRRRRRALGAGEVCAAPGVRARQLPAAGRRILRLRLPRRLHHRPPSSLRRRPRLSAGTATLAIGLVGLFNVVGSYAAGVLGTRHSPRLLLAGIYGARAIVITVFLLVPPSASSVLVFAAAMEGSVAVDGPAHLGLGRHVLRRPAHRHALRLRLSCPPGRRVRRRVARRRDKRAQPPAPTTPCGGRASSLA